MLLGGLADSEASMGDTGAAESHAQEALRLADEAGDSRVNFFALNTLSNLALRRGDHDEALSRALQMLEEAGDDERLRSNALGHAAFLELEMGRDLEARTKLVQANDLARATGNVVYELEGTIWLANLELYTHDFEAARRLAISVLDKVTGDYFRTTRGLNALGLALVGLDRRGEARDAFAHSLDLVVTSGMTGGEGLLTEALAGIAYATEKARFDSAAQLLGAVHRLNGEAGFDPGPRRRELGHSFAQPLIDALGAEKYASEQAKGATMGLDDAVELARSLLSS